MNFNVHRRNNSIGSQGSRERKEGRSLKKVAHQPALDYLFQQAKQLYQSQGDLARAVDLFSQYIAVNPRHNQALYLCAVSELKLNQAENALTHLVCISEEYQSKPNAILLSAMALNKLGTYKGRQVKSIRVCKWSMTVSENIRASRRQSVSGESFIYLSSTTIGLKLTSKVLLQTQKPLFWLTILWETAIVVKENQIKQQGPT